MPIVFVSNQTQAPVATAKPTPKKRTPKVAVSSRQFDFSWIFLSFTCDHHSDRPWPSLEPLLKGLQVPEDFKHGTTVGWRLAVISRYECRFD